MDAVNDKYRVSAPVGSYMPNPWGLYDMHGNAAEWTRSAYRPYPWRGEDGCNMAVPGEDRVVRGGSWYDRPVRARSAFRQHYPQWQRLFNVGFRVVCTNLDTAKKTP
jgi:formylglycine-generating enzyme required for sulfatase activity